MDLITPRPPRASGTPSANAKPPAETRDAVARATTREPAPRLLDRVPGIADVVWAIATRVADEGLPIRLHFSGAEPGAGNTVIAAATALGLVQHLRVPVCLVETDVERPSLAAFLGLSAIGLSDVLDGRARLEDAVQSPLGFPDLHVLPAGSARSAVSGEFSTARMRSILAELGELGRYVVIDAPPLADRLESRLLLQESQGAVLVLRAHETRATSAAKAQKILLESGVAVLGSIFNAHGSRTAHRPPAPYVVEEGSRVPTFAPAVLPQDALDALEALHAGPFDRVAGDDGGVTNRIADGLPLDATEAQRKIDMLERRVAKLTHLLEITEANLRRIAAAKNIDLGIASIYRGVQGLPLEEEALAFKRNLMKEIFQANLELKHAIETEHP